MIKYPLFYPTVNKQRIIEKLNSVFESKFIGQGPLVDSFEWRIDDYLSDFYSANNNHRAVMVNSGTAGLHLSYILAGIKAGDEVLTPCLTCTATNHPLLWMGAIPVFVDIQENTLNVDPRDIEKKITDKTKAIVVMHNGGLACDMDAIMQIAKDHNLKVIEDACQAMGGTYHGIKLGTIGDFGVYSLQAIKNLTVGDGGILICKNPEDYERAKKLRWFGIDRNAKINANWQPFNQRAMTFDVDEPGYKYQATDIDAAIGLAQLPDLADNLKIRNEYAEIYRQELRGVPGIKILCHEGHANWLFQIIVGDREWFQSELGKRGVETNMVQVDNRMYTVFKKYNTDCPTMDRLRDNYVSLPLHPHLSAEDIYDICSIIKDVMSQK